MRVLGIDQSMRATGWAFFGSPEFDRPNFGVWRDSNWFEHADELDLHLVMFRDRLTTMIKTWHITDVCCEQTLIVRGKGARNRTHENSDEVIKATQWLECLVRVACVDTGCNFHQAKINDWRKEFLQLSGEQLGNMRRDDFKRAAVERCQDLKWGAISHDAAEACGIMDYKMRQLSDEYRHRMSRFTLEG